MGVIWQGHSGRRPTRHGDVSSTVGDVGRGKAVSSFGCTAFVHRWFWRRGLRHTQEGDAWREYGGKTAEIRDANPRRVSV